MEDKSFSAIFNIRALLSLSVYNYAQANPLPYVNADRHVLSAFFTVVSLYAALSFVVAKIDGSKSVTFLKTYMMDALTLIVVVYCTIMLKQMLNVTDGFSWLDYGVYFLSYSVILMGPTIEYGTTSQKAKSNTR